MKFISLIHQFLSILILQSCSVLRTSIPFSSSSLITVEAHAGYTYEDIDDKVTYWSNIFTRLEDDYLIYLFSTTCNHCNAIKEEVIEFALSDIYPIYFIYSSPEITIDSKKAENIGVSSLSELGIRGYPTLLVLDDKVVTKNLAGESQITSYLRLLKESA